MHSYVHNLLPSSFENVWPTNRQRRETEDQPRLRSDQEIFQPFARTNLASNLPLVALPKLWNSFGDDDLKFVRNKNEFNSKLKKKIFKDLVQKFTCPRNNCPSCTPPPPPPPLP